MGWRAPRLPKRFLLGAAAAACVAVVALPAVVAPATRVAVRPAPVAQALTCQEAEGAHAWRQVAAPGPGARSLQAAAFDRARGVAVFFGGVRADLAVLGDVWTFSPLTETWQEVVVPGEGPTPRWAASAVEDVPRGRILVLFGNDGLPREDVWALDLARPAWERLSAGTAGSVGSVAPPGRFDAAVATDGGDRVWAYGGFPWSPANPDLVLGDLWELDLASGAWRQRFPALTQPPERMPPATTNASLAYHGGTLYLAGGHTVAGATPGTWRYDLATETWDEVLVPGAPAAWAHQARAMDETCGRLLLAGGDNADGRDVPHLEALQLGPSGGALGVSPPGSEARYVRLPGEAVGVSRHHSAMALDPASRQLILFGGWQGNSVFLGDTWLYRLGSPAG